MKYTVSPGHSVLHKSSMYTERMALPDAVIDDLGEEQIQGLLKTGHLSAFDMSLNAPPEPIGAPRGKWFHNPKELNGKDLKKLNLMVAAVDPTVEPFDTVEEAIAQLSEDWKG